MGKLALYGGTPVRTKSFPSRPGLGRTERHAVKTVLGTGVLSGFLAETGDGFLGGPRVRALEDAWCERFNVPYAVSMNSATSALYAALIACRVGPGDEVIVTPWSMSASASCVLMAGATPVFADIEPDMYGLDPKSVEKLVTKKTKAIVLVHLFGNPARLVEIERICADHGLKLIEDASQAPGAIYHNNYVGTRGHVGVFSLNYHKTIQAGEGGVAVTNIDSVAERLRLVRNHGEAVVSGSRKRLLGDSPHSDIVGGNFRLGEIPAAIAEAQLVRLDKLTAPRRTNALRISDTLAEMAPFYTVPVRRLNCSSAYYLYDVRIKESLPGMAHMALRAEGIPVQRYVRPLYYLPVFGEQIQEIREAHPEVERAYREVVVHPLVHAGMTEEDVGDVIAAFRKVYEHRREL